MTTENQTANLKRILSSQPYFSDLDDTLLEMISQKAKRQKYDTGQVVFLEGEQNAALHIVQSGWLKAIKMSPDGREQVMHFIGGGEVFNLMGIFVETKNPASIITLEPSALWTIQQDVMLKLVEDHPKLGRIIIQRLVNRVQHLVNLVEDLSLRSIEARLARYLLEESTAELLKRPRWATQAEMASRLGTVPDVLSRALRSLVKENLISVERHQIQILDYVGLEAKAGLGK